MPTKRGPKRGPQVPFHGRRAELASIGLRCWCNTQTGAKAQLGLQMLCWHLSIATNKRALPQQPQVWQAAHWMIGVCVRAKERLPHMWEPFVETVCSQVSSPQHSCANAESTLWGLSSLHTLLGPKDGWRWRRGLRIHTLTWQRVDGYKFLQPNQ